MKRLIGIFALSIFTITAGMGMAHAEQVCKVTDPTGTPLNIRDKPNGKIINKLNYAMTVKFISQKPFTIIKTVLGCI